MPEYLSPGVYVEEVDTGSKPIEGVSTSTAGFVGVTARGPTSGLPTLVTSFADFNRKFGGYLKGVPQEFAYLPYAVDGFFNNGGKRVYIMRVVPSGADLPVSTVAKGGLVTRLVKDFRVAKDNQNPPQPQAEQKLKTKTLRGIQVGTKLQLRMIKEGISKDSPVLTVTAIERATGEITANVAAGSSWTLDEFMARYTLVFTDSNGTITPLADPLSPRPDTVTITAKDAGSWGKNIAIQVAHDKSVARAELASFESGAVDDNKIRLTSAAGFYPKAWVEIDRGNTKLYRRVKSVDGTVLTLEGPALVAGDVAPELGAPNNVTLVSTCEFRLTVSYGGVTEQYSGLTLENISGRYCIDQINNSSKLISIALPTGTPPTHPFAFPSGVLPSGDDGTQVLLDTGGSDDMGRPTVDDYLGVDNGPGQRTGLKALEDIDQISIIAAPGVTLPRVQQALIEQCQLLKDRFAILDPEPNSDLEKIQKQRQLFDTKYAAIYYPLLRIYDPITKTEISAPPSGHMAGIYARSDIERGVHKAPANEVIAGITGLEVIVNKGEQDILNPSPVNINVLRDFRSSGRGYRVWGARVMTSDPDWKYINVRRLFIFIEESIDEGTQWVVFEPNDEPLWARVRRSVSAFLTNVWRDGALQGKTPEEAFFVKCDRTTMSQFDIDNGRLIMQIGIAPVKPAEFVIFRIGQWAGGSEVAEG
jgi:uncharacterized protein